MKVLISSYHNPNFTNTTIYREKAIEYLGHEIITFDDRQFLLPGRMREQFPALHNWDLKNLNNRLVKLADKTRPDVCMVVGGQRILPDAILKLKGMGVKVILWTTDVPIDFENILQCAPLYDQLFCAGTEALDIFHHEGLKKATWVPFACDPNYHKPVTLNEEQKREYGRDIVFVGSYYPNRAELLESIADLNIGVWGPYWSNLDEQSPLRKKVMDIKMNYDQWVKIYSASKIVMVIHYQNPDIACHQTSPKLFEAMACGSFVLTDSQRDAKSLFEDGRELGFFESQKNLREKIEYYLKHQQERQKIALTGFQEVSKNHTYQNRMEQMLAQTV